MNQILHLNLNFNLFNSLILAGCIQGFIFALIWLFNKKYRSKNTYYLIALILIYSLSNLQYYLLDIGIFDPVDFYNLYVLPLSPVMPALLLLYGLTLLQKQNWITKNPWIPFIPIGFVMLLNLYYKLQILFKIKEVEYSHFLDQIPSWSEYLAILYSLVVLFYLLIEVQKFSKKKRYSKDHIRPQVKWFRWILIAQILSTSLWLILEVAYGDGYESSYYYPLWIILAIIIYWMGHVGIYKYGVQVERKNIRTISRDRKPTLTIERSKNEYIVELDKILIEEKSFLDPTLSLESLAQKMNLSKGYLSKIINSELGCSFKEHLNQLRVAEAKSYLTNPEFSNYTLVAIGLEAGFSSKSSFNATFKKISGLTPSEYKKKHIN